ncbi:MAG: CPCC family cysteine-rich protein [Cytobacillus gottheilii]|uniref:CPCC family cysteine-rich protein n=1 Tax=Cytobacillus gottheilii TaxID=859144 RepID=UPI000836EF1C|nr:CPCC family cysteine-rich protein [Cytobacillus gottheilii]
MNYTCPCCGYKTLDEEPPGTYEICYWEDDAIQFNAPDDAGGANVVSLKQAQYNFNRFGACDENSGSFVREPTSKDIKDSNWNALI